MYKNGLHAKEVDVVVTEENHGTGNAFGHTFIESCSFHSNLATNIAINASDLVCLTISLSHLYRPNQEAVDFYSHVPVGMVLQDIINHVFNIKHS